MLTLGADLQRRCAKTRSGCRYEPWFLWHNCDDPWCPRERQKIDWCTYGHYSTFVD